MTFWEVDILEVDILGVDVLGVDILERTQLEYKTTYGVTVVITVY